MATLYLCLYVKPSTLFLSLFHSLSLCMQIAAGILQLGFITQFLSDSLVSGYTCAAAFTIAITQIRSIFGLPRDIPRGGYFANIKVKVYRSCVK